MRVYKQETHNPDPHLVVDLAISWYTTNSFLGDLNATINAYPTR